MDELRTGLELATTEELVQLTDVLFRPKFNPLDYVQTPNPVDLQSQSRQAWIDRLEQRFRFLAADGVTVLQGRTQRITYRQALVQVCRYLKLPYSASLSTVDLEAEVFLHLLGRAWQQLPAQERSVLNAALQRSLTQAELTQQLPRSLQRDPMGLLLKGGSAIAVSSLIQPFLLQQMARQFAIHFASYQMAKQAIVQGGAAAAAQFQGYVAMHMAKRGMALSVARYSAVRSVFTVLGPALWAWFLADLGWRAIATNYSRIIPTVFALAQIRLTRAEFLGAV